MNRRSFSISAGAALLGSAPLIRAQSESKIISG